MALSFGLAFKLAYNRESAYRTLIDLGNPQYGQKDPPVRANILLYSPQFTHNHGPFRTRGRPPSMAQQFLRRSLPTRPRMLLLYLATTDTQQDRAISHLHRRRRQNHPPTLRLRLPPLLHPRQFETFGDRDSRCQMSVLRHRAPGFLVFALPISVIVLPKSVIVFLILGLCSTLARDFVAIIFSFHFSSCTHSYDKHMMTSIYKTR